ncbi:VOC family protein [Streptomyces sp. NPDC023723]|uniref:VOC family protein n=1 Tax=Streptomyces sp. NPDC023723 TaxID=3154323 RepID=UPI0033EAB0AF
MTESRGRAGQDGDDTALRIPGTPCWVSLMAHGLEATQEFYGALFGWEFRPGPQQLGPYLRALLDGREVAGIGQLPPDRRLPVAWTPYLASDDVDRTAGTVRSCGGTVAVGPLDAAEAGRMLLASDPSGAVFGVWQAAAHLGTAVTGVPGTPAWNELVTYTAAGVATFYVTAFGHAQKAVPATGRDYVTLHVDGRPVAGVRGVGDALPRDRGPHWVTYFETADVADAVRRVAGLGGRVLEGVREDDLGRVAMVADREGARFALLERAPG